jgi:acetyltransferase-like isoleucine patch superfamily enzyme
MKFKEEPRIDEYVDVAYYQYNQGPFFKSLWKTLTFLCVPFLLPLILTAKSSDYVFKACSEFLSLVPSLFGFIMRYAFYKFTLDSCGENVLIDFGTVFYYLKITIGNNVTFDIGNIVQHCDFGNNVLISDSCRFIGGVKKHNFDKTDVPIVYQGGKIKKIRVENDTWIDSNAIVMETVGHGSVIIAGPVVTKVVEPYSICSGNPAKVIGKRRQILRGSI